MTNPNSPNTALPNSPRPLSKWQSLEHRLPPPIVAFAVGLIMAGTRFLQSPVALDPRVRFAIAAVVGAFALLISAAGMLAFRRAKTTINPVQIDAAARVVSGGVFRYTRNPMYLGLTAALTCWAVVLAVPLALLGPVAFALFIHRFQILPEERVLTAKFGREYEDYRARVRRWL